MTEEKRVLMIHLDHPCYTIDFQEVDAKHVNELRGQGYVPLDEARSAVKEKQCLLITQQEIHSLRLRHQEANDLVDALIDKQLENRKLLHPVLVALLRKELSVVPVPDGATHAVLEVSVSYTVGEPQSEESQYMEGVGGCIAATYLAVSEIVRSTDVPSAIQNR